MHSVVSTISNVFWNIRRAFVEFSIIKLEQLEIFQGTFFNRRRESKVCYGFNGNRQRNIVECAEYKLQETMIYYQYSNPSHNILYKGSNLLMRSVRDNIEQEIYYYEVSANDIGKF